LNDSHPSNPPSNVGSVASGNLIRRFFIIAAGSELWFRVSWFEVSFRTMYNVLDSSCEGIKSFLDVGEFI